MKGVDVGYRAVAEAYNDVAFMQSGALGRAVLLDADNENAASGLQMVTAHQSAVNRHVLSGDANKSTLDLSILDQAACNELCSIDGDREANSLRGQKHGRVHANDLTMKYNHRTALITGI